MHPDAPAFFRQEPGQNKIVKVDEAVKQAPRGIELHRQPSLGEVHLNLMRALVETTAYLGFMLVQQILDELLARIIRNPFAIHQTEGRRRYYRLLDRHVRIAHGDIQVPVSVPPVTERTACEPRHAARMTVRKWNYKTIWRRVRKPIHAVRAEVVILPLFAIGNK